MGLGRKKGSWWRCQGEVSWGRHGCRTTHGLSRSAAGPFALGCGRTTLGRDSRQNHCGAGVDSAWRLSQTLGRLRCLQTHHCPARHSRNGGLTSKRYSQLLKRVTDTSTSAYHTGTRTLTHTQKERETHLEVRLRGRPAVHTLARSADWDYGSCFPCLV